VILQSIDQPPVEFTSPFDVFQCVLEHEQSVTAIIYRLYELVIGEKDYAAQVTLQWFITEQIEEEKNVSDIVEKMKMMKGEHASLLLLDRHLASR
jgi:ferritin